ncbi:MAG: iron-sulfur cluster repair di-iron protein [Chitinophagaceae bacterium]|nr:iron-sulfur cluster repair di-iron protein [Chitinophagaceae bacterium]
MDTAQKNILIVPELPPMIKHSTIFNRFDELAPGEELIIINDHDPKPLYYQLQATRGEIFQWEYLEDGPDTWRIKITKTGSMPDVLNVTLIEPRLKHPTIFAKFDNLQPGEAFILFNDHDPRPLYFQLSQMRGDTFTWEYLEQGPYDFRILITKKPLPTEEKSEAQSTSADNSNDEVLDVTVLPHGRKHPIIFEKFDSLQPGEAFILHNDHDPKPLYYQMVGERGEIFTWEYLEQGPEVWRIRIAKKTLSGPAEETLGDIVAKDLRKAEVFKKHGIDFCCGGKKTVREACAEKGVDVNVVIKELSESDKLTASAGRPLPYNDWSLDFLADYIINTHHSYVKKTMPDLVQYSAKVTKVHGDRHPELHEVNRLVQETMKEMAEHTIEEESVLFPYIKKLARNENGENGNLEEQIDLRIDEHELVGGNMDKIREITQNYTLPDDACASYTYLFKTLDEFEEDLHVHVHLENNILFPKAIKLAKGESLN